MKHKIQYTKILVTVLLIFGILWISTSYVLGAIALFRSGEVDLLSNLSKQVCVTILGTILAYCLKSYAETNAEKKNELEHLKLELLEDDVVETTEEVCG